MSIRLCIANNHAHVPIFKIAKKPKLSRNEGVLLKFGKLQTIS